MKYCKNCSASNSYDASFCNNCGGTEFVSRYGEDIKNNIQEKNTKLNKRIIMCLGAVVVCAAAVLIAAAVILS